MINLKKNKLTVQVFPDRQSMGKSAASDVAQAICKLLKEKEEINMIFAAAPSQNDFLAALIADKSIAWNRINAFHMDEYIGLDPNAPQGFGNFLSEHIFAKVAFKQVYYIQAKKDGFEAECERYTRLLSERAIDIICMGIGENGHIAFNDPHVADFNDKDWMKVVDLAPQCREQQVHDGCFQSLDEVPTQAFTLTIPILMSAAYTFCIVPASTKAEAVYNTLYAPLCEEYPSTILREKENARLYLDMESGSLLPVEILTNP
ncbi:6-phosphogluconolactonase [uncultured Parabacteroides sp.]|jgi:glucosamine-6-phosphate deaminase|uniref:6-phosphogluconolactonase n=1 Tax=uncultured Parabacteroides sp. TaxID=512312 RepID=UPI0025E35D79|nr:6-phosphogluconolactonase [uncultured Parabacteroides sp.]